jgi:hypothetical protein
MTTTATLKPGDPVRVVEHDNTTRQPRPHGRVFGGEVMAVTEAYVIVRYTHPAPRRRDRMATDQFWRDSRWRAWDGEFRWHLEPGRLCAWCETDIAAPGAANPVMYARASDPNANWECLDIPGCQRRQAVLDRRAGLLPIPAFWRVPIAELEPAP